MNDLISRQAAGRSEEGVKVMSEKLKPCPFCGEKPTADTNGSLTWFYCWHCDARGPRVQNGRWAKKKAIEAWNRRSENG